MSAATPAQVQELKSILGSADKPRPSVLGKLFSNKTFWIGWGITMALGVVAAVLVIELRKPPTKYWCSPTGCMAVGHNDPHYKEAAATMSSCRQNCMGYKCENNKCVPQFNWDAGVGPQFKDTPNGPSALTSCHQECANATKFVCNEDEKGDKGCMPSSEPVTAADVTSNSVFPIAAEGDSRVDDALKMCMEYDATRKICSNTYKQCSSGVECPGGECVPKPGGCSTQTWACPNKVGTPFYGSCQPFYQPMMKVAGHEGAVPNPSAQPVYGGADENSQGKTQNEVLSAMCKGNGCQLYKEKGECDPECKWCGGGNAGVSYGTLKLDNGVGTCVCNPGYAGDDCDACAAGRGPLYPACGLYKLEAGGPRQAICASQDNFFDGYMCGQCGAGASQYSKYWQWNACTNTSQLWSTEPGDKLTLYNKNDWNGGNSGVMNNTTSVGSASDLDSNGGGKWGPSFSQAGGCASNGCLPQPLHSGGAQVFEQITMEAVRADGSVAYTEVPAATGTRYDAHWQTTPDKLSNGSNWDEHIPACPEGWKLVNGVCTTI